MGNRKRKAIWIAGGVFLAVVVLSILVLLFGAIALKPRIEAAASKVLKMDVRIRGGGSVSFFPILGASFADITIKNGEADVATVADAKVGLKLLPLIWGKVKVTRLELVKPVVSIVRQKDGTLNIPTIETRKGKPSGKRIAFKKLAIFEGSLLYTDLRSGGKTEWQGVDISVTDLSAGGTPGEDPLNTLSLTGDIRCRAIRAGGFSLADIEMKVVGDKGVCDISHAGKRVLGGTGSGTLHADFTGAEPHFRVILAVSKLKIEELLQESPDPKNMEGLAELSADLTASGEDRHRSEAIPQRPSFAERREYHAPWHGYR